MKWSTVTCKNQLKYIHKVFVHCYFPSFQLWYSKRGTEGSWLAAASVFTALWLDVTVTEWYLGACMIWHDCFKCDLVTSVKLDVEKIIIKRIGLEVGVTSPLHQSSASSYCWIRSLLVFWCVNMLGSGRHHPPHPYTTPHPSPGVWRQLIEPSGGGGEEGAAGCSTHLGGAW